MNAKSSTDFDKKVGARVKELRLLRGVSQEKLGEELGVSFQQIQKYERGSNRVSAGRLFQIARFFNVPITWFFDLPNEIAEASEARGEHYRLVGRLAQIENTNLARLLLKIADEFIEEQDRKIKPLRATAE